MAQIYLAVTMSHDLKERIKQLAVADGRTASGYVLNVIHKHLRSLDQEKTRHSIPALREFYENL